MLRATSCVKDDFTIYNITFSQVFLHVTSTFPLTQVYKNLRSCVPVFLPVVNRSNIPLS